MSLPIPSLPIAEPSRGDGIEDQVWLEIEVDGRSPSSEEKDGMIDTSELLWAEKQGLFESRPHLWNSLMSRLLGLRPPPGQEVPYKILPDVGTDDLGRLTTATVMLHGEAFLLSFTYGLDGYMEEMALEHSGDIFSTAIVFLPETLGGSVCLSPTLTASSGNGPKRLPERLDDVCFESAEKTPDVISLYAGQSASMPPPPSEPAGHEDILGSMQGKEIEAPTHQDETTQAIESLLREFASGNPEQRVVAIRHAGAEYAREPEVAGMLLEGLRDTHSSVRTEAARVLQGNLGFGPFARGSRNLERALGDLGRMLDSETDTLARTSALLTLAAFDLNHFAIHKKYDDLIREFARTLDPETEAYRYLNDFMNSPSSRYRGARIIP